MPVSHLDWFLSAISQAGIKEPVDIVIIMIILLHLLITSIHLFCQLRFQGAPAIDGIEQKELFMSTVRGMGGTHDIHVANSMKQEFNALLDATMKENVEKLLKKVDE